MAVTQDNLATKVVQSDVTSASWSHTCGGSNKLLLVFVGANYASTPTVTYNGSEMTLADKQDTLNANKRGVFLYYMVNPPSGTYTVSVTNVNIGYIKAYSVSLAGVNQSNPLGTVAKTRSGSAGNNPSVSVTSATGDLVYDMTVCQGNSGSLSYTPGSGQTGVLDSNSVSYLGAAGSRANGGQSTMSWTMSNSFEWAILASPIKPVIVSPTITTGASSDITTKSATLAGNVTDSGYGTITERGVCWSLSKNPTTSDSKATSAGTTGEFTIIATGLSPLKTYHYRAYATNSAGTAYGSDSTFKTKSAGGSFLLNFI